METLVDDHRQLEPNALADGQPVGSEFQMTTQETAKSLAPITVRVRPTTSFWVSANLNCRLPATDETSTQSSAKYSVANLSI